MAENVSEHDVPQRTRSRRSGRRLIRAILARLGRSRRRLARAILAGVAAILVLGGTGPSVDSGTLHGGASNPPAYSHQQPHSFNWPPTTLAITETSAEEELDTDPGTSGPPRPGDTSRDSQG
jgi:hypothetical protein